MSITSSLVTVKGALFDLLDDAVELVDVEVGYGWVSAAERIIVGGTADWDEQWATLGELHRRDERFTLELIVETLVGATQRESTERAGDLFETVGRLLLPKPDIVVDGQILDLQLVAHTLHEGAWDESWGARIEAGVRLHVRL